MGMYTELNLGNMFNTTKSTKLYRKLCRPYASEGCWTGFKETYICLEDWTPEENKNDLINKYTDDVLLKKGLTGKLYFEYKYVEVEHEEL